jgi:hypothetical protein
LSGLPLSQLLAELQLCPILVDIGASGAPPAIWNEISDTSVYVGFDPDPRTMPKASRYGFRRTIVVDKIVTADQQSREARFFLTRSPYCSSTLEPDSGSLSNFLFAELFAVEKETSLPATTLEEVITHHSLPAIDWLKTDSQGTDLRLFRSLPREIRARVLAVDVEPGLIDAYVGEDLFVDTHKELSASGHWLSDLTIGGAVRMRRETWEKVAKADRRLVLEAAERRLKKAPAWCEARYLRTLDSLAAIGCGRREYLLLGVFAMLDGHHGCALEVANEYERKLGGDGRAEALRGAAVQRLRSSTATPFRRGIHALLPRGARRWLGRHLQRWR